MKNPNGYGSVYKLSGNRRKPWAARKTVGWDFDESKKTAKPIYEFVGFYKTQREALLALANYNENPYSLSDINLTFSDLYEKWSDVYYNKISDSGISGHKAAYSICSEIHDMRFADIRLDHLQSIVDKSGKNTPTLKKLKILLGLMYDYAVIHDIVNHDKREKIRYLDISKPGNPNAYSRTRLKKSEIKKIWSVENENIYYSIPLILIYSGVRIGELLDLKKEDVCLHEKWFYVKKSKTKAGIRIVPISDKIMSFFEYWMSRNCDYLICDEDNNKMSYDKFYYGHWKKIMSKIEISHTPHCARHTCISMLTEAGVDSRCIKQIVGHAGRNVTEDVYTDISIEVKLKAINKI